MNPILPFFCRVRKLVVILLLAFSLPVFAACPPDTFVDRANFSHVDDDPGADGSNDKGGYAVATNGEVVAMGMVGHPAHDTHRVYLYRRGAGIGQWTYLKSLAQPGFSRTSDHFAEVLAMDGDTLVVGAKAAGAQSSNFAGAVYVFQRNQGGPDQWGIRQSVYANPADGFRDFGESLDIHRNRMVIGDTVGNGGRAVVYERSSSGANFVAVAELLPPGADLAREVSFAKKVTLYGDIAVVSDPGFRNAADTAAEGRAYVYARDQGGVGQWGLVTTLTSPTSTPPSGTIEFGSAISTWGSDDKTRGETIAVSNQHQEGHVFLFGRDTGGIDNWGQIVDLQPSDSGSGEFGASLHLHSNELLVGDPAATGIENLTGAVYVYHQQTGGSNNWGQAQKFYSQSNNSRSNYGFALDWSAGVAVIGDPLADYAPDSAVGRTYVLFDDLIFCNPFE
ncbi:MAG: hypothetical protein WBW92_05335, partial [Rhodanobacteraceae bacterium]